MSKCRICRRGDPARVLDVPEMMFGTRETFSYEHCGECGSLQIENVPQDVSRYYPSDYYAHSAPRGVVALLRELVLTAWYAIPVLAPKALHRMLAAMPLLGVRLETSPFQPLASVGLRRDYRILDVGGGNGEKLRVLRRLRYRNLTLVDPAAPFDGKRRGIRYLRGRIVDVEGQYDLIMFHHSLEHVPDLDEELTAARTRLAADGRVLVRMPKLPNAAFERYGASWVQIDAPRHTHIPTVEGFRLVAERSGLTVEASGDDSTDFQFWGSDEYARGIPRPKSRVLRRGRAALLAPARWGERRRAAELNAKGLGDQGWFILRHADAAANR
jgi:SAM-dependent methyltransferase